MSFVARFSPARLACAVTFFAGSLLAVAGTAQAQEETAPAAAPAAAPAVALRIVVLDTAKVLKESEEGIRIEANLRKLFDPKKAELGTKEKQLSEEYEELEREEKTKGRSEPLERRKAEFKQKVAMLQQDAYTIQQDYNQKRQDSLMPLLGKVGAIVKSIAQREGYDLVLEKQAAVYFRTDLELTERVIQAVNAGEGPKDPKAPKKPKDKPAPAKAPAAPKK